MRPLTKGSRQKPAELGHEHCASDGLCCYTPPAGDQPAQRVEPSRMRQCLPCPSALQQRTHVASRNPTSPTPWPVTPEDSRDDWTKQLLPRIVSAYGSFPRPGPHLPVFAICLIIKNTLRDGVPSLDSGRKQVLLTQRDEAKLVTTPGPQPLRNGVPSPEFGRKSVLPTQRDEAELHNATTEAARKSTSAKPEGSAREAHN